jgi:hypothetical protein
MMLPEDYFPSRSILGSPEWTMRLGHRRRSDGCLFYYADVFRAGAFVHRLALPEAVDNRIAAEVALDEQVRKWVSAYVTQEHTGVTDFGELGKL